MEVATTKCWFLVIEIIIFLLFSHNQKIMCHECCFMLSSQQFVTFICVRKTRINQYHKFYLSGYFDFDSLKSPCESFESLWAVWATSLPHTAAIMTEESSASDWEGDDLIPRERTCDKPLYSYLTNGEPHNWCWYSHSWWRGVSLRGLTCVTMERSIMKHNKQQIATAISRW